MHLFILPNYVQFHVNTPRSSWSGTPELAREYFTILATVLTIIGFSMRLIAHTDPYVRRSLDAGQPNAAVAK